MSTASGENILGNSPADQNTDSRTQAPALPLPPADPATAFTKKQPEGEQENANDWWPESADGQCSESAALFAASQPAPLSIV